MGKAANRRRKQIFEELGKSGRLDVPLYVAERALKPSKQRGPAKSESKCCLVKYQNNLPMNFRKCHGCPLDTEGDL